MSAQLIDGNLVSANIRHQLQQDINRLKTEHHITPGLAVILVGNDPASQIYVRNKHKRALECGMNSFEYRLEAQCSQPDLLTLIHKLNTDPQVHGILVQLPLPAHIESQTILCAIDPRKDVDGFHPINVGLLATHNGGIAPCTPLGCMALLDHYIGEIGGCRAVIVGRSNIVGKPMAQLLLAKNATVTITHSQTHDMAWEVAQADIVIAALGKPHFIKGEWLKKNVIVIDIGINRTATGLVGDVDFTAALPIASFITPVPGGVGPMTIAMLLQNTYQAALALAGL